MKDLRFSEELKKRLDEAGGGGRLVQFPEAQKIFFEILDELQDRVERLETRLGLE